MKRDFEYSSLQDEQAARQLSQILAQGFVVAAETEFAHMERIGFERFRVMHRGNDLLGGLVTLPMGQWFGGKSVAMVGIASVVIAPSARGGGIALALMNQVLQELHQQKVALSTLYPAVQQLYRQVGYEQGGTFCKWSLSPADIREKSPTLPISPLPLDWRPLVSLAQKQSAHHNGLLERHVTLWRNIVDPVSQIPCFAYSWGSPDDPQGYLVFSQERTSQGNILRVLDRVVLTPAAIQSFWAFLATHRSQIDQIHWQGGAIDPTCIALAEQSATLQSGIRWMTRIVCVDEALTQRGYPLGLEGELHLEIRDEVLPENQGKWILQVSQGQGQVSRGGRGDLQFDIRGLAPMYTGLFSPQQLRQMGYLEGSDRSMALAGQIFGGASPWLADFF